MAKRTKDQGLGTQDGRAIVATGLDIRKTGSGLNQAMAVEPRIFKHGDRIFVVLECVMVGLDFDVEDRKNPSDGGLTRIHVLDAGNATFIDEDVVREALEQQAEKIRVWQEEQSGVHRMKGLDLAGDHLLGEHKEGRVDECPKCIEEIELEKAGK